MSQLKIFQNKGGDVQVNVLKDDSLVALQGWVNIIKFRAKVG
jgi:hypothetical protein